MVRYLAWLGVAFFASVWAQDLQGDCITCLDKLLKCEVDCLMPNFSEGESFAWPYNTPATQEQVTDCTSLCAKQYDLCEDTDEAVACLACATACAITYDTAMRECLTTVSTTTKATANANQDACSNEASYTMDTCLSTCSELDKFGGWTPEKEMGVAARKRTIQTFTVPKQNTKPVSISDTLPASMDRKLASSPPSVEQPSSRMSWMTAVGIASAVSGSIVIGGVFVVLKLTSAA